MDLTIGFSPCPNDTFIFDALIHGRIPFAHNLEPVLADVEQLNQWALTGKLDITKLSYAGYLQVRDSYTLLRAGGAMGYGVGPLLVAKRAMRTEDVIASRIALPGELTTAHMLFSLRYPDARDKAFMLFSEIENAVLNGDADAGVIIHENRFTYASKGLVKVLDLGTWWEESTGHPIPLGAIAVKKDMDRKMILEIDRAVRQSVEYAFAYPEVSAAYVREHAHEMSEEVTRKHIATYVNNFSLDIGSQGESAIEELISRAKIAGLI